MGRLNQTVGWDSRWEWDRIPMGDLSLLLFVSMGGGLGLSSEVTAGQSAIMLGDLGLLLDVDVDDSVISREVGLAARGVGWWIQEQMGSIR